jgi:phosphoribosylaminoimidazole-succinocarboxamide synthase
MTAVRESDLPFPLLRKGKVREMYDLGEHLLMVASDRISAFDVVLPQPIPDKGAVLTQISRFWFSKTTHLVQNHCVSADPDEIVALRPELSDTRDRWAGRGMLVTPAQPFPVECVVRGFITGSAWKEYRESGTLAGEPLPEGLVEAQELDPPVFSPATKAEEGHDENISFDRMRAIVGTKVAEHLRGVSLDLYAAARSFARERGILIADTKFEFGASATGEVLLIDEALTPDSSRFWPAADYEPGRTPPSLDKQPVRDWLEARVRDGDWDKRPPGPDLPDEVVTATSERYREAYRRLTGEELPRYGGRDRP